MAGPVPVSPHSLACGHLCPVETLGGGFVGVKYQMGASAEGSATAASPSPGGNA